ncbi:MAG: lipocalin-like domain-containing protein [Xanthobacteraceae bacterium]
MSGQSNPKSEVVERLCGAWRYVGAMIDGKPRPGRRGMIYYDRNGAMVVQVAPDQQRGKAGSAPTPEEAHAALADYVAYFGTYSVDERAGTVTHHRHASVQPGDVGDLVRGYEFVGDRLILRPPGTTYEVIWERIR